MWSNIHDILHLDPGGEVDGPGGAPAVADLGDGQEAPDGAVVEDPAAGGQQQLPLRARDPETARFYRGYYVGNLILVPVSEYFWIY